MFMRVYLIRKCFGVLVLLFGMIQVVQAQRLPNYTVLQAGGIFGVNSSEDKPMNGYQFQFVFGKHLYEKTFFGLGIGNDVYRGNTTLPNGGNSTLRMNVLPIFADFRQAAFDVSILSKVGFVANAGYAPSLGSNYYQGFMGKVGMTYSLLLADNSDLQFTLGVGSQHFDSRYINKKSHQYHVFLTVGLFTY